MDTNGDAVRRWDHEKNSLVLDGEPRLAYQPVVDLASGHLLGFEALLRWQHPTEGTISPQLLIPWAEANGDILPLGAWVLFEGCQRATSWPCSVQLAVNCSVVQLRRRVAAEAVGQALSESGLDPDRLTIEVTERCLSDETAGAELRKITALGVQLAVDDVGTSWNSFELLRRLAVNTVKIDESFVTGLEPREGINRMVVETVVHLAHSSGMATVAEGVETSLHASIVRGFDSDAAQGYFFAPPMTEASATAMANVVDLQFPLEGRGWQDDDDWPFPGVEAESWLDETPIKGAHAAPNGAGGLAAPSQLDAIDLVELALEAPTGAAVSGGSDSAQAVAESATSAAVDEVPAEEAKATPEATAKPAAKRPTRRASKAAGGNGSTRSRASGGASKSSKPRKRPPPRNRPTS